MRLRDEVAIVTGGGRGLGRAFALGLASEGAQVVVASRTQSHLDQAASEIVSLGGRALAVTVNLEEEPSVQNLVERTLKEFGKVDILVNNAGILLDESNNIPSKTDLQIVKATLETNLIGAWRLCQSFVPMMKKNNYGRIVNVSSGAGALNTIQQSLYAPAYSLTKSSLNVLTIMFANELSREAVNILVNAVDPGWVRTDMGGPTAPRSAEEGADTAVWLATLPDRGPTGGYFFDRKRIEW